MSRDVVINWTGYKPTKNEIEMLLQDYIGAAGTVEWDADADRYIVTIPGTPSYARVRVGAATPVQRAAWRGKMTEPLPKRWSQDSRFFEVWSDKDCTYVMTRDADELTNAIADTLAKILCQSWRGEIQPA